jgi:hypothetical protein
MLAVEVPALILLLLKTPIPASDWWHYHLHAIASQSMLWW